MKKAELLKKYESISKSTVDYLIDEAVQLKLNQACEKLRRKKPVSTNKKPNQEAAVKLNRGPREVARLFLLSLSAIFAPLLLDLTWNTNIDGNIKISMRQFLVLALLVLIFLIVLVLLI